MFVTRMPVVRIIDLAQVLIEIVAPLYYRKPSQIEIRCIGPRPGEKLYEELTTEEELRRTLDLDELYAVLPAFRNIYDRISYDYANSRAVAKAYNSSSEPAMSRGVLRNFLLQPGVLPSGVAALLDGQVRAAANGRVPADILVPGQLLDRPEDAGVLQAKFA